MKHNSLGLFFVKTALNFASHTRVFLAITTGGLLLRQLFVFPENVRSRKRYSIGALPHRRAVAGQRHRPRRAHFNLGLDKRTYVQPPTYLDDPVRGSEMVKI